MHRSHRKPSRAPSNARLAQTRSERLSFRPLLSREPPRTDRCAAQLCPPRGARAVGGAKMSQSPSKRREMDVMKLCEEPRALDTSMCLSLSGRQTRKLHGLIRSPQAGTLTGALRERSAG